MSMGSLRLPRLIGDGMVLQRNTAVKIWGWAAEGEIVTVEFIGRSYTATAGKDGSWKTELEAAEAGGPHDMTIGAGDQVITVKDILIGDVWVCSGQSNMQLNVSRVRDLYEDEISRFNNDKIRQYMVPERVNFKAPQDDLQGGVWIGAKSENVLNFAAVGFFFAAALYKEYQVPIGLINASIGGTPIEAWLGEESLKGFPQHLEELVKCKDDAYIEGIRQRDAEASSAWFGQLDHTDEGLGEYGLPWYSETADESDWSAMVLPAVWAEKGLKDFCGAVWFRKEIEIPSGLAGLPALLRLGTIVDSDKTWINGVFVGETTYRYPPRKYQIPAGVLKEGRNVIAVRAVSNKAEGEFIKDKLYRMEIGGRIIDLSGKWKYRIGASLQNPLPDTTFIQYKPSGLYNGMIAPVMKHTVKGILWYQGESNTSRAAEYDKLLTVLIRDWRREWKLGSLPFFIVQLPNFLKPACQPGQSDWAELREAQQKTLFLPDTAIVVAIDAGEWNDVHPLNKKTVGDRLALAARCVAYEEDIVYCGPVFQDLRIEGNRIFVRFSNIGKGLAVGPEVGAVAGPEAGLPAVVTAIRAVGENGQLKHFAIAGADRKFVWANAEIQNDTVIVWNDQITDPVAVRYAWADNPAGANLYNRDGLPASPFRTDTWDH